MDFSRNISLWRNFHCCYATLTIYFSDNVSFCFHFSTISKFENETYSILSIVGENYSNQELQQHFQLEPYITLTLLYLY